MIFHVGKTGKMKSKSRDNFIFRWEIVFLGALIIYIVSNILAGSVLTYSSTDQLTVMHYITKLCRYVAYAMFTLKIIYDAYYSRRSLVYLLIIFSLVGLTYLGCVNKTILFYLLVVVAAIGIPSNHVLKVTCWTQVIMLILLVAGSQLGIIMDYVRVDSGRIRHFLGFSWTTTGPILFLFVMLQYIFLKCGVISWIEGLILLFVSSFFYIMTNARLAFFMSVASITFFLLFNKSIKNGRFVITLKKIFIMIPEMIALFAFAIHYFYNPNNQIFYRLNTLLSGRLYLGKNAIEKYGIHLFGQKIEWIGYGISENLRGEYNYVDCSYLQIIVEYGVVFLLLVLAIYSLMIKKSIENKQYYLTWILLIILVFSITEPRLLNLTFNPFVFLAVTGDQRIDNDEYKNKYQIIQEGTV